jgi:hypothetical protein
MDAATLVEMNRVDAVINFRSLDLDDVVAKYPVIPIRHPVIRKLCDPIIIIPVPVNEVVVKEVMNTSDATEETDVYLSSDERMRAQLEAIETYGKDYGVEQDNTPLVSDWVGARYCGKEDFTLGVIKEIYVDSLDMPEAFDILYDQEDGELVADEDPASVAGAMVQHRYFETNVPLDRVVFIQNRLKKTSKKRRRNE